MSILYRIQAAADQLADSEAKVARVILENPKLLEHYTITTLAQESETSTSAVLRFCHTLGFGGYKDFRYALASELRAQTTEGDARNPLREVAQGMAEAVGALANLDPADLELLATQLAQASTVFCLGIHRSFLPAEKLRMDLEDLGILAISARDAVQMTHLANLVGEHSCTVVFSASGTQGNYRAALDTGLAAQGHSWLVTSSARSQLSGLMEHTIVLPSVRHIGTGTVDDHPIAMAFVELLVQQVREQLAGRA